MPPFHLLQITDCHLGSQPGEKLINMNTDEGLCDVLQLLKDNENPDLLLVTGDISNDGGVKSYERYVEFVEQYFPDVPLAWLPGNHDAPSSMEIVKKKLSAENKKDIIVNQHLADNWNLIFLDSKIPRNEGGDLQPSELQRLEDELKANRDKPTLIFLHHQIIPVGCAWVDVYQVKSHEAFLDIIDRYDNVKAVSWGHVHQAFHKDYNGVAMIATPSTCVQFTPENDAFRVDTKMPGYRSYQLYPDGKFTTKVHRVKKKDYHIDFDSKGY